MKIGGNHDKAYSPPFPSLSGALQRPLPDNTQHSQKRDNHARGGILTRNLIKRPAADRRLKPLGPWDRLQYTLRQ